MKITVVNGTEKHGVTYELKEIFLKNFKGCSEITEYYLPRDCSKFCTGCTECILKGENNCNNAKQINILEKSLLESDLIVMTTPTYVFHASSAMKNFLDHFAYRWMPHRPAGAMFKKRAVIITQCVGAGAKSAARDIKYSLSWWGISNVKVFKTALRTEIIWSRIPETQKNKIIKSINNFSTQIAIASCTNFKK